MILGIYIVQLYSSVSGYTVQESGSRSLKERLNWEQIEELIVLSAPCFFEDFKGSL